MEEVKSEQQKDELEEGSIRSNSLTILPFDRKKNSDCILVARTKKDCAFLENVQSLSSFVGDDCVLWHTFDDSSMYRPNEEVHLKGYLRLFLRSAFEHRRVVGKEKIHYYLKDSRSQLVEEGDLQTNEYGAFDLSTTLPDNLNLGPATITFLWKRTKEEESIHTHTFHVEEFRRLPFKAECSLHSKGPYFLKR